LRLLRTRLGRIIRDIRRKIDGNTETEAAFAIALARASQVRSQQQRQRDTSSVRTDTSSKRQNLLRTPVEMTALGTFETCRRTLSMSVYEG